MDRAEIPLLDLTDDACTFARRIGESFRRHGFALVANHGIDAALIDQAWSLARCLFDQTDDQKRACFQPGTAGARGYTPFGTEVAKGAPVQDLKEFWHVGRDLPPGHPLSSPSMPPNVWPEDLPGFRKAFTRLFREFDAVGTVLLSRIALHLGLSADWFEPAIADANSVLRLAHYPPLTDDPGKAMRAGPHEDINLITLLLGAEEAGLELLGTDGTWLAVDPPEGAMVVNIGDMLQRLTNHVLPSTTHRVRNPVGEAARRSRYSMPFFVHLRSDFVLETLSQCVATDNPDRYPEAISADVYLQDRLREIGLRD